MNLRYLTFGCFSLIGLMIFCALAGLFVDSRPDVGVRIEQGASVVLVVLTLLIILAILTLLVYLRRSGTKVIGAYGISPRPGPGRPRNVYVPAQETRIKDNIGLDQG